MLSTISTKDSFESWRIKINASIGELNLLNIPGTSFGVSKVAGKSGDVTLFAADITDFTTAVDARIASYGITTTTFSDGGTF